MYVYDTLFFLFKFQRNAQNYSVKESDLVNFENVGTDVNSFGQETFLLYFL